MAKPITTIKTNERSAEERQAESLQELTQSVTEHKEALEQTLLLMQQLHDSGALEMLTALVGARDKIARVALSQAAQPAITNTINHVVNTADVLGQLDPHVTKKVLQSVVHGVERASATLERPEQVGLFDLYKALKDPGINRAVAVGLSFLKGMGDNL